MAGTDPEGKSGTMADQSCAWRFHQVFGDRANYDDITEGARLCVWASMCATTLENSDPGAILRSNNCDALPHSITGI